MKKNSGKEREGLYKATTTILLIIVVILAFTLVKQSFLTLTSKTSEAATVIPVYDADEEKYSWEIKEIATGLDVPWDLALTEDNRILITERDGKVKLLETDGKIKEIADFPQVASVGESGMTGLELHPDFSENGYLYIYYTYRNSGDILNRISRFTFNSEGLFDEVIILDNLPGGSIHNGGRMKFGPDKKLWVTTGDASRPALAQDLNSLAGKVLRMNEDGSVPEDNPIPGSLVFSSGHRNPQGIDFHPLSEEIIVSSHGETAFDEINLVSAGSNHGWPYFKKCVSDKPGFVDPILCSNEETWAPSGLAFMGMSIWRFRYSFVFAGLRGERLERIALIDSKVAERETIIKGEYGRLRAVIADKQGNLYVSTSNKDGRGQIRDGDDKILKITPKKI
jgi:aldose sugar dehydrogenase